MANKTRRDPIDWQQVFLHGDEPCFCIPDGPDGTRFCLRAKRWAGHATDHGFKSLDDLFAEQDAALKAAVKLGVSRLYQEADVEPVDLAMAANTPRGR